MVSQNSDVKVVDTDSDVKAQVRDASAKKMLKFMHTPIYCLIVLTGLVISSCVHSQAEYNFYESFFICS